MGQKGSASVSSCPQPWHSTARLRVISEYSGGPRTIGHARQGSGSPSASYCVVASVNALRRKLIRFQMSVSENAFANAGIALPG